MSYKIVAAAGAGALIVGMGAVGAVSTIRKAPAAAVDTSQPAYVRTFISTCRSGVRERNAAAICNCMASNLEGALVTDDEYKLAGAIVIAIVEAGPNRSRMQSRFDKISQEYYGRVSIERKASVLKSVSTQGVACANARA